MKLVTSAEMRQIESAAEAQGVSLADLMEQAIFKTELDEMEPVRVKVRGWGIEAVVSAFSDERFERFAAKDGIVDAEDAPLSLEELFLALAGEGKDPAR